MARAPGICRQTWCTAIAPCPECRLLGIWCKEWKGGGWGVSLYNLLEVWPCWSQLCSLSSSSRQAPCSALTPVLCCDADIAPPLWAFKCVCECKLGEIQDLFFKTRCLWIQRYDYKNWLNRAHISSVCTGTPFSCYAGPQSWHRVKSVFNLYLLLYSTISSSSLRNLFLSSE